MRLRDFFLLFILISSSLTYGGGDLGRSSHIFTGGSEQANNETVLSDISIISREKNASSVIDSISNETVLVTLLDGAYFEDLMDSDGNFVDYRSVGYEYYGTNYSSLSGEIHLYDVDNYSDVIKIHIRGHWVWFHTDSSSLVWHNDLIAITFSYDVFFLIKGQRVECNSLELLKLCSAIILLNESGEIVEIKNYPMRANLIQTNDGSSMWALTTNFLDWYVSPKPLIYVSIGRVGESNSILDSDVELFMFPSKSRLVLSDNEKFILDMVAINEGETSGYCGLVYESRALVILNHTTAYSCIRPIPLRHESVIIADEMNRVTVFEGSKTINRENGEPELKLTIGRLENYSHINVLGNLTFSGMQSLVRGCSSSSSSYFLLLSNDSRDDRRFLLRDFQQSILHLTFDEGNDSIQVATLVNVTFEQEGPSTIEDGIQLTECSPDLLRFSVIHGNWVVSPHGYNNDSYYDFTGDGENVKANVSVPYTGYSFNFSAPSVFFELRNYSEIPSEWREFDPVYIPTVNQSNPENNNSDNLSADGNNSTTNDDENETSVAENNSALIGTNTGENDSTSIENNEMADCLDDNSNEFEYPTHCNNGNSSGIDGVEEPLKGEGESTPSIKVYQIDERKAILAGLGFVATFILLVIFLKKLQI